MVGDLHLDALVGVALVDGVLRLERIVFVVLHPAPVPRIWHGVAHHPAPVFPVPCRLGQSVGLREPGYRGPPPVIQYRIPVAGQNLPLVERQVPPRNVAYAIIFHGASSVVLVFCTINDTAADGTFHLRLPIGVPPGRAAPRRDLRPQALFALLLLLCAPLQFHSI